MTDVRLLRQLEQSLRFAFHSLQRPLAAYRQQLRAVHALNVNYSFRQELNARGTSYSSSHRCYSGGGRLVSITTPSSRWSLR